MSNKENLGTYKPPFTLTLQDLQWPILQALASGPKADAIVLLGSLYTYPWTEEPLKQQIVVTIKDVARTESDQFNRSDNVEF